MLSFCAMAITTRLRWILTGERGIRPGWRFALFVALCVACGPLFDWFLPKIHFPDRAMDWFSLLMNEALDFALASVFTLILCRIEGNRFSNRQRQVLHDAHKRICTLQKGV